MTGVKKDNQIIIYPGETLEELLEERGMTQSELSERMGRPLKTINEIIKGKSSITADTSIQLERVFGVPAHFWLSLESNYQLDLARLAFNENLESEFSIAKQYPYKEMMKLGWIAVAIEVNEIVQALLDFFGVTSLKNIVEKNIFATGAQYRMSVKKGYSNTAITAWLRKGVIDAQKISTNDFDETLLKEKLSDIKSLIISSPQDFVPKITHILAECGVALVITKNLKNAPINGVTRWLSPKKALIQMSIRGKYADIFWFSLFHELGHILLHRKKEVYVDFGEGGFDESQEKQADDFASDFLIPKDSLVTFLDNFAKSGEINLIKKFAKQISVSEGIVIGRMQHEGLLKPSQLNSLRSKYEWVE